ncbi:MAG: DUF3298 and DUF4163 domain-containing protein [Clostridiales bacterium]|nr:DUF3298 and DUF4163 domain-containing protein [Clostridiales bacterium]
MKKKSSLLALCLALCLALTACGGTQTTQSEDESGSAAPDASASAEAEPAEESADASTEVEPAETSEVEADTSTTDTASEGTENTSITFETVEGSVIGDDGKEIVTYSYQVPTVTLADAAAQAAVQADLDAVVETFVTYVQDEMGPQAKETYETYYEDTDNEFPGYSDELTFTLARVDDAVISLVIDEVGYSGGAHGWDTRYCRNYDAQTGETLAFELLGENFRSAAEELVLAKAAEMQAEDTVFFDIYADSISFVVCDGTETYAEIYARLYPDVYGENGTEEAPEGNLEPTFYLTEDGIIFLSGEYVMQPYAGGIVEIALSYDDFIDVMNSQYML